MTYTHSCRQSDGRRGGDMGGETEKGPRSGPDKEVKGVATKNINEAVVGTKLCYRTEY